MLNKKDIAPESSAARVALWRALHLQVDAPPPVIDDPLGLRLLAPEEGWRNRPDMHPEHTKLFRISIVARARFIDDLAAEQAALGVDQYVILGAGLDTFAQRKPEIAAKLKIFEVDKPGPQAWKEQRLRELGLGVPEYLRFVPVDFEAGASWWKELNAGGFDAKKPALIASTGVAMYLTKEAITATLRQIAALAPGSRLAMTYLLPMEMADPEERVGREMAEKGARNSGTPFLSYFTPDQITALAKEAGFKKATTVAAADLAKRYFANRTDGLRPSKSEEILLAAT